MTTETSKNSEQQEEDKTWYPVQIRKVDHRAVEYESVDPGHVLGCRIAYFSFRARHSTTGRPCYIDREFYRHRDDPEATSPEGLSIHRRVAREASVLRALSSCDRVRRLVDVFRDDCWIWRVYESPASREKRWYDAGALRWLLTNDESTAEEIRSVLRQLLLALEHCHSREIVHSRVRPKSVLLIPRTTNANGEGNDDGCSEQERGGGRFDVKLTSFEFAHRFGDNKRYPPNKHFPPNPSCHDYDAPELLLLAEGGKETTTPTTRTSSPSSSSSPSLLHEFATTNTKYDSDDATAAAEAVAATATTTAESDIWAAGSTFFELVAARPLFPGMSQIDTLFRIFRQLGTPYDDKGGNEVKDDGDSRFDFGPKNRWPGVSDLPHYDPRVFPNWRRGGLPWPEEARRGLGAGGLSLLSDLVRLDPRRRITARDALRHAYFSTPGKRK